MKLPSIAPRTWILLATLSLLASPAVGYDGTIYSGIDLFSTPANGETFVNFFQDPVPADFFCPGSEPLTDLVDLKGVPLATAQPGAVGNTDTIMERLDDAAFNDKGMAITRLRVAALSLESIEPIHTRCGDFRLRVTGDGGPQPVTEMQIFRTHRYGGFFMAPLELRVQLIFEPLRRGGGEARSLTRQISLRTLAKDHKWAYSSATQSLEHPGSLAVQLAHPGAAGYLTLPGTSNFAALWGLSEQTAASGTATMDDVAPTPTASASETCNHFIQAPTSL